LGEIASPSQLRLSFLRWALVAVPLILLLGIGSGRLSGSSYGNPWFQALTKPEFMPPGWAFGAAWTILYAMMGFALAMVLHARRARQRRMAITLFALQLVLNLAWSPLFFGAHKVVPAFWLLVAILISATATTLLFRRIRPAAALLMVPYLAWLIFATVLNFEIHRLNPQAETLAPGTSSTQINL
jgi:tryptophan-rich sensory protein